MTVKNTFLTLGSLGENYAQKLLQKKGYKIIDKNFRSRFGEIDLIAITSGTLVFVEVKARRTTRRGLPEEAVDERKLHKIRLTADYYNLLHPKALKKQRIEVVSLIVDVDNKIVRERHIRADV